MSRPVRPRSRTSTIDDDERGHLDGQGFGDHRQP
jgi:hypothetical protein